MPNVLIMAAVAASLLALLLLASRFIQEQVPIADLAVDSEAAHPFCSLRPVKFARKLC